MGEAEASADERLWLFARLGAAVVSPKKALRAAAANPGRTAGDAALLLVLYFCAVHTREAVQAGWLVVAGEVFQGLMELLMQLARAVRGPLLFLFVSGVGMTLLAGRRRSLGADFDLACVAFVPLVLVHVAANLIIYLASLTVDDTFTLLVNVVSFGWAGAVLYLGWRQARLRPESNDGD